MIKRGYTDMLTTTKHTVEPMQGEADAGNLCTKVHMFGTHGQSRTSAPRSTCLAPTASHALMMTSPQAFRCWVKNEKPSIQNEKA